MAIDSTELLVIGKFTTFFGVRGWLKVYSYTEPVENLLNYPEPYVELNGHWQPLKLAEGKPHGKGLVVRIEGVEDREQARPFCQRNIAVPKASLPALAGNDFYWHQLEGLKVEALSEQGEPVILGTIEQMMETGANDVMVVRGNSNSIDQQERLIPYLDHVVRNIDIEAGVIQVNWDPEF